MKTSFLSEWSFTKTLALAGAFRLMLFAVALFVSLGAQAQTPQISVQTNSVDSIQQTTIVPVQRPPIRIVEHTTDYEESTKGMDRVERRAYKAKLYAAKIDSLVQSRDYMFLPNSMQQRPEGMIRLVVANYFFFGMFIDHVEVHLPTERGLTQYVEMLNFDSKSISDYTAERMQWGWNIAMTITNGDDIYHADLEVSTTTGETVLTLVTPALAMRYVGWLWNKKVNDPRYHRLD